MVLILSLYACQKAEKTQKEEAKSPPLQIGQVLYQEVASYIDATGSVEPDKDGLVKISPRLPGVLQSLNVNVGDRVRAGELLAVVKAPDSTDLYAQKLSLNAQLANAERLYKLKEELYQIGAVPKSEVMDAETNYKVLKAQLQGVEEKLKILGGGKGGLSGVYAPMEGIVYQIKARPGDSVDTSTEILSLVRPSRVLVVAQLPEKEAFHVKVGDKVEFSISVFPDRTYTGRVKYVSDVVDPETRTVKVYIVPDRVEDFKVNMFFKIRIYTGKSTYAVIPESALLYKEGRFFVYTMEDGKAVLKEVQFVKELEGKRVAVLGLQEGQKVVLNPMLEEKP